MEETVIPLTEKELATTLAISFAALRARGHVGKTISDGFAADKLAASLWLGGFRPFKVEREPHGPSFMSKMPKPD